MVEALADRRRRLVGMAQRLVPLRDTPIMDRSFATSSTKVVATRGPSARTTLPNCTHVILQMLRGGFVGGWVTAARTMLTTLSFEMGSWMARFWRLGARVIGKGRPELVKQTLLVRQRVSLSAFGTPPVHVMELQPPILRFKRSNPPLPRTQFHPHPHVVHPRPQEVNPPLFRELLMRVGLVAPSLRHCHL